MTARSKSQPMSVGFVKRTGFVATVAASLAPLSACIGPPVCDPPSAFQKAASYDWMINGQRYAEPLNTWVRNEGLEAFLAKAVRSGGIDVLRSQYGFRCSLRLVAPPCGDCYTCSLSLPKLPNLREPMPIICSPVGEMLMQVDVGPGSTLTAMTYWKRDPVQPRP